MSAIQNWMAKLAAKAAAGKAVATANMQKSPTAVPNLSTDYRWIPNGESKLPITVSTLHHFKIDRDSIIAGIQLIHDSVTPTGGSSGSLTANAIWKEIKMYLEQGKTLLDLNYARNGMTPAGIMLFNIQKLFAGHANFPNECWDLPCIPYLPAREGAPNVSLDLQVGAIGDFVGGDRTTYTGAQAYLQIHSATKEAWAAMKRPASPPAMVQIIERNSNSFGASEGWQEFSLPTGVVYDERGIILHVQDNGSLADEKFDEIIVKRGQDEIYRGHERFLKLATQKEAWQTLTGFYWIKFDAPVDTKNVDSMKVEVEIPTAGTDIIFTPITCTQIRL